MVANFTYYSFAWSYHFSFFFIIYFIIALSHSFLPLIKILLELLKLHLHYHSIAFLTSDQILGHSVVVMPRTILPQRNRRCAPSAAGTRKSEEEKDAGGVTCFMEENEISLCEVARFDEHKSEVENSSILLMSDWCTSISSFCKLSELTSVQ